MASAGFLEVRKFLHAGQPSYPRTLDLEADPAEELRITLQAGTCGLRRRRVVSVFRVTMATATRHLEEPCPSCATLPTERRYTS